MSPLAQAEQSELPSQPAAIDRPSHAAHPIDQSQDTQTPIKPPPPDTRQSQGGENPTDESNDIVLVDDPPAIIFRFFEYNSTSLKPMSLVSRANMERKWIWFKRDGSRFRTIRADKVIDFYGQIAGFAILSYAERPSKLVDTE